MKSTAKIAIFLCLIFVGALCAAAGGSYTLAVGQSQVLTFTPREGGKGFAWSSADPAAVEVTAQNGSTTATVTARRGTAHPVTVSCSYTVTVQGAGFSYDDPVSEDFYISVPLEVTGVEIPATLELYKGAIYAFSPRVLPEGAATELSWTSGNTAVATVNQLGELTAVSEGSADITVRAATGHSATCRVAVILPTAQLRCSVNHSYVLRGTAVELTATPADATIRYTLDGSEPTASSALYTAPIVVDRDLTLKAFAARANYYDSPVLAREYRLSTLAAEAVYPDDGAELMRPGIVPAVTFSSDICRGPAFDAISLTDAAGRTVDTQAGISGHTLFLIPAADLAPGAYTLSLPLNSITDYSGEYNQPLHTAFSISTTSVKHISSYRQHSAAIMSDGSLWTWGQNEFGALGHGTETDKYTPTKIMDNVKSVFLSDYHSAAIKQDDSLWMWGKIYNGELYTTIDYAPVKIMDDVATVSLASTHCLALKHDGSLWAWGSNSGGRLGDGTISSKHTPIKIMDNVAMISSVGDFSTAIKRDGTLWTWGENYHGELGDERVGHSRYIPSKIMDDVATVSAKFYFCSAIKNDGSLWTWGDNYSGRLGDGTETDRYTPVKILEGVKSVSLGDGHCAAIKRDGSLWTWGSNEYGRLGDGSISDRKKPVKVLENVSSISILRYSNVALKNDGSIWTWGWNYNGELGNGSLVDIKTPTQIMDNVEMISSGTSHCAVIKRDGSLWTWGNNDYGQLGDGSKEYKKIPTKIDLNRATEASSLSLGDAVVATGGRAVVLPRTEPADASYRSIEWSSSNDGVATVDSRGVVTGIADGEATLTATITGYDGNSLSATCRVQVYANAGVGAVESGRPDGELRTEGLTLRVDAAARILSAAGVELHRSDSAPTRWTAPAPGVYIVLSADGSSRKVLLR